MRPNEWAGNKWLSVSKRDDWTKPLWRHAERPMRKMPKPANAPGTIRGSTSPEVQPPATMTPMEASTNVAHPPREVAADRVAPMAPTKATPPSRPR